MHKLEIENMAHVAGIGMAFKKSGDGIIVTGLSNVGSAAKSQRLCKGTIITKVNGGDEKCGGCGGCAGCRGRAL